MAFYFVNQYGVYSIRKAEMDGKIKIFENLESNEYKVEEMEAHKISYKRKALKGQVLAPFAIAGISYCGINVLMGNELLASNKTALYFSGLLGALTHECAYRPLLEWHEAHKPRFSDQIEIGFSNDEHQFQYTFSPHFLRLVFQNNEYYYVRKKSFISTARLFSMHLHGSNAF